MKIYEYSKDTNNFPCGRRIQTTIHVIDESASRIQTTVHSIDESAPRIHTTIDMIDESPPRIQASSIDMIVTYDVLVRQRQGGKRGMLVLVGVAHLPTLEICEKIGWIGPTRASVKWVSTIKRLAYVESSMFSSKRLAFSSGRCLSRVSTWRCWNK